MKTTGEKLLALYSQLKERIKMMPKKRKVKKGSGRTEVKKRQKIKSETDQKARHTDALTKLLVDAKEINARLEKAGTLDGKADDHRLAAA
ncbi:hypothetical protein LCGC14_0582710, partial [marine sediment metagenome]